MNVADIGEFGLIQRLTHMLNEAGVATTASKSNPLLVGPGDDAAAWQTSAGIMLSTTDTVVERVHFTQQTIPWRDLGWKVIAANLSDIAAMGGSPLYALVTLGLPQDTPVAAMEELYEGLIEICREYGTSIAGGDVVGSPTAFISVTLNGVHAASPLLRSQARPGDLLAVTGYLGSSLGGLELMTGDRRMDIDKAAKEHLLQAHRRPRPRLQEGRILVEQGVRAAMDISDGLVDDLAKMMEASGNAAHLEAWRVPIHPHLARAFPDQALAMALSGGEDYQLLYAAPSPVIEETLSRIPGATVVGQVIEGLPGHVLVVDEKGEEVPLPRGGWDHFRT